MLAHLRLIQVLLSCGLLLFETVPCVSWSGLNGGLAVDVDRRVVNPITVSGSEIAIDVKTSGCFS